MTINEVEVSWYGDEPGTDGSQILREDQAEELADEMRAAGYDVVISAVNEDAC